VVQIESISTVIRGASPRPKGDKRFYGGDIPRLMVEDVTRDGKTVFPSIDFLTEEGAKRSRPCKVGTLTLVCSGTVGIPSFLGVDACIHDGFIGLVNISTRVEDDFLYHQLTTLRKRFEQSATHGGVFTNLTTGGVKEFPIPLPPTLHEQRLIARALSDADAAIAAQEALIAKKEAILQGTKQELLTGKRRLPGFAQSTRYKQTEFGITSRDWIEMEWKDVFDGFTSGMTPYRGKPHYYTGKIPWITSGELNYNVVIDTLEKITENAIADTNLKIHPVGTFLIAITGLEAAGTRGSCAITGVPATTNQSCMAIFPKDRRVLTEYLFHFYSYFGDYLALRYCQGTKQQSYTAKIVRKLPIVLPPTLHEQQQIAQVLSDMNSELDALRTQLNKLNQIKEGMKQELLTGRTRLI